MNPDILARLAALGTSADYIDEKFVRGSGPGGQKINKTSSTVWLRHRPTGIEVRCQKERSQSANREQAWSELCSKLEERQRAVTAAREHDRESHGQKLRMIASKKVRAGIKSTRGRVGIE
jgi:protein subunit release factor B